MWAPQDTHRPLGGTFVFVAPQVGQTTGDAFLVLVAIAA